MSLRARPEQGQIPDPAHSERNSGEKTSNGTMSESKGRAAQDKQKELLASNTGHFSLVRALHLADLITELNGFCGFMSILFSMRYAIGPPESHGNVMIALALIPLGLFFDFMDGKVARWRGKSSLMGQELDSLADLISFGVAPATAAFALGLRTPLDSICLAFFVLCGLTRLARFNVTVSSLPKDKMGKSKYFEGFPIPTSLALVLGMAICVQLGKVEGGYSGEILGGSVHLIGHRGITPNTLPKGNNMTSPSLTQSWALIHPIVGVFVLWGCALVSKSIHIPKP